VRPGPNEACANSEGESRSYHRSIDPARSDYIALLWRIHRYVIPSTYVEIGVYQGESFCQALPKTLAVGIDPILNRLQPVNPRARYFPLKSDEFFAKHDLHAVLNGQSVDLAFIDGMHLFEFALRDFMNLERFCRSESTILLHDCYPRDRESAGREPTQFWTGDVWKLILCLNQHRPDLRVFVVDIPPAGVGIISNLNPRSTVLRNHYDEVCRAFIDLDYAVLEDGKEDKLSVVPDDWKLIRDLLPRNARNGAFECESGEFDFNRAGK
jgi:methyltransferase family protein